MVLLLYRQSSLVVQILYTGSLESYHLFRSIDTFSSSRKTKQNKKVIFGGFSFCLPETFVSVCVAQGKEWNTHTHTHTGGQQKREIGTSPKTPDRIKRLFKHAQDTCNARTAPQREEREHFLFFLISKRRKRKKKKNPLWLFHVVVFWGCLIHIGKRPPSLDVSQIKDEGHKTVSLT